MAVIKNSFSMIIADLHIRGSYSRACSKALTVPNLEKYAKIKGIDLLGTGDFTHPKWLEHIKESLKETSEGSGIYETKTGQKFLLSTEVSLISHRKEREESPKRIHERIWKEKKARTSFIPFTAISCWRSFIKDWARRNTPKISKWR
jgi:PHP family Zn ribbon phosphoesterase